MPFPRSYVWNMNQCSQSGAVSSSLDPLLVLHGHGKASEASMIIHNNTNYVFRCGYGGQDLAENVAAESFGFVRGKSSKLAGIWKQKRNVNIGKDAKYPTKKKKKTDCDSSNGGHE